MLSFFRKNDNNFENNLNFGFDYTNNVIKTYIRRYLTFIF